MEDSYLNKYYGLEPRTLEAFPSNEDILDIKPISIETTPIKPPSNVKQTLSKSSGFRLFFGKKPKTFNSSALVLSKFLHKRQVAVVL